MCDTAHNPPQGIGTIQAHPPANYPLPLNDWRDPAPGQLKCPGAIFMAGMNRIRRHELEYPFALFRTPGDGMCASARRIPARERTIAKQAGAGNESKSSRRGGTESQALAT